MFLIGIYIKKNSFKSTVARSVEYTKRNKVKRYCDYLNSLINFINKSSLGLVIWHLSGMLEVLGLNLLEANILCSPCPLEETVKCKPRS